MPIRRDVKLCMCAVLTLASYYLLFTGTGNYMHGGTITELISLEVVVVLAAYLSWEIVRTERQKSVRVVSALFGLPLAAFVVFALVNGVRYAAI